MISSPGRGEQQEESLTRISLMPATTILISRFSLLFFLSGFSFFNVVKSISEILFFAFQPPRIDPSCLGENWMRQSICLSSAFCYLLFCTRYYLKTHYTTQKISCQCRYLIGLPRHSGIGFVILCLCILRIAAD